MQPPRREFMSEMRELIDTELDTVCGGHHGHHGHHGGSSTSASSAISSISAISSYRKTLPCRLLWLSALTPAPSICSVSPTLSPKLRMPAHSLAAPRGE